MTYFLDNTCYSKCPEGFFGLADLDRCVKDCPSGLYKDLNTSLCKPCPNPCKTCESSGTKVLCSSCITDFFFDNLTRSCNNGCPAPRVGNLTTMTCVDKCLEGFFPSGSLRICDRCSGSCKTCEKIDSSCTSCKNESFLLNNTCVKSCPIGKIQNTTSSKCEGKCFIQNSPK